MRRERMGIIPVFGEKLNGIDYRPRPGAYGILINEQGLMALIFIHGGYYLPGGGRERGESIAECLKRELLEELGCGFGTAAAIGRANEYFKSLSEEHYYLWQGEYFLISDFHFISEPTDKTHSVVWLPGDEAENALRHESQRWAVGKALEKTKMWHGGNIC